MCQFIVENQGVQTFLVYCWKENEDVDQACYQLIHDVQISGILPTFLSEKDGKSCLKFNITSRKSLNAISNGGIKCDDFFQMLTKVIDILINCEEYAFEENNFILDCQYIFVKEDTKEVQLLFVPVIQPIEEESLENRLKQMILQLEYSSSENTAFVSELVKYLEQESFSLKKFKGYIEQMYADREPEWKKVLQEGKVRMPELNLSKTRQPEPAQEDWTGPELQTGEGKPAAESGMASAKDISMETKSRPIIIHTNQFTKAFLKRCKTNEKVQIDKQVFKIGTERDFVDYCITDNPTISRNHANIVIEKDEYYIIDMNSKNHTAVNGRMLMGVEKAKLIHGSIVQLSDELFEFCLET